MKKINDTHYSILQSASCLYHIEISFLICFFIFLKYQLCLKYIKNNQVSISSGINIFAFFWLQVVWICTIFAWNLSVIDWSDGMANFYNFWIIWHLIFVYILFMLYHKNKLVIGLLSVKKINFLFVERWKRLQRLTHCESWSSFIPKI